MSEAYNPKVVQIAVHEYALLALFDNGEIASFSIQLGWQKIPLPVGDFWKEQDAKHP